MTVIAGISLVDGVMLLSDTRITWERRGGPPWHWDVGQKIIKLSDTSAIAFAGDVLTAAELIQQLNRQLKRRERQDASSLRRWIPRFLAAEYKRITEISKTHPVVHFIVGSVLRNTANRLPKSKIFNMVNEIRSGKSPVTAASFPGMNFGMNAGLTAGEDYEIPNSEKPILYKMTSPGFVPQDVGALDFCAIGSGARCRLDIHKNAPATIMLCPGNSFVESKAFRESVAEHLINNKIDSVGGHYPCVKITKYGIEYLGISQNINGIKVVLEFDKTAQNWVQKNLSTGKSVDLLPPWKICSCVVSSHKKFDDWHDAVAAFNPRRKRM